MRTTPVITIYSKDGKKNVVTDWATGSEVVGVSTSNVTPYGFAISKTNGFTKGVIYTFHYTANAEL